MSYYKGRRGNIMERHLAVLYVTSPDVSGPEEQPGSCVIALTFIHICSLYLNKVQQAPEAPGNRIEPFRTGIRPLRVNKLCKVPICKVAVPEA